MKIWSRISYLGVDGSESDSDRKTNILTNRLAFFTCVTVAAWVPILFITDSYISAISYAILLPFMISVFYFTVKGKHEIGAFILVIILTIYIVSLTVIEEIMTSKVSANFIHIFLIPILLFGVTLTKKIKYSIRSAILILCGFAIMELIKRVVPIQGNDPELTNVILHIVQVSSVFITVIYTIHHYRLLNLQYSIDIVNQKLQLEKAHYEMKDSIEYAKKIQSAILPSDKLVRKYFASSFVLYFPKDIVAGDFYWTQEIDNHILFAVADCTGHGVPGALVSVVCNNALNRAVREYKLSGTGEILDKTREIVIREFEKSEENVADGMDIAMIKMPVNTNDNGNVMIEYSGANNPLWILRGNEVLEFSPCKQPIGKYAKQTPFKTQQVKLLKGDNLYIFSDGFVDQFGGEKGKKFKNKALRTLLKEVSHLDMDNQKRYIKNTFMAWKGNYEQVDDVCLIGVKI